MLIGTTFPHRAAAAFAAVTAVAAASAPAADAACRKSSRVTPGSCFPARIAGSFSGRDDERAWHGTVTLTRHREQTIYLYTGRARVTWKFREPVFDRGHCRWMPGGGTLTTRVELQVNRVPDRKRGWSYLASSGSGADTGPQASVCQGERRDEGHGFISGLFDFGGFSPDLRHFGSLRAR